MNRKSKEEVIEALKLASKITNNGVLTKMQFIRNSDITISDVYRHFQKWSDACQEAGVEYDRTHEPLSDEEILCDWGTVTRKLGHIPTMSEYHHNGKHGRNVFKRFGKWTDIPDAFIRIYNDSDEWRDVVEISNKLSQKPKKVRIPSEPREYNRRGDMRSHQKIPDRPIYGPPINFRGLRHAPVNEQGVVLLFGMVADELGYQVESVQIGYPDCEAKRKIAKGQWQAVQIEFEYESKNFLTEGGHDPKKCDVIVCWIHNWAECPENLEVLALSEIIKKL
jgi:hypothetical protein